MHHALRRYAEPPRGVPFFGLGILAGVMGLALVYELAQEHHRVEAQRAVRRDHARDLADAKVAVARYAFEAFPAWVMDHPDVACPSDQGQLAVYLGPLASADPWGSPYEIACDAGGRLEAWSVGPDRVSRTADDVSSR